MKELEYDVLESLIEKMDGESTPAYTAFLYYAQLTPPERLADDVIAKVAKYMGREHSTVRLYRQNYDWETRAEMVDAYRFKLDFEESREATRADRMKYVEFNREIKTQMMENLKKTTGVIATLIGYADLIGEEKQTGEIETKDGRKVFQFTTVNMKAKVSDIAILANSVAKCARAINDLPTEVIENKVAANVKLDGLDSDALDALDAEVAEQIKKIESRVIMTDGAIN